MPPFPNVPPGYRRREDGSLEPHPEEAPIVAEAFRRRAEGATVMEVRDYLREHGIERTFHGTQALLTSRIVLGELRFGELVNDQAHIRRSSTRRPGSASRGCALRAVAGRSPNGCSPGSAFSAAAPAARGWSLGRSQGAVPALSLPADRRLPAAGDDQRRGRRAGGRGRCPRAARGNARHRRPLRTGSPRPSAISNGRAELDAAVRAFQGLDDVDAARERLPELRVGRDRTRERLAELEAAAAPAVTISASGDWDDLTLDERRALITAVVLRADVAPGRGSDRISVQART